MNCTGSSGDAGREHLAASRDAVRPVREAACRVVRPDDEARPHDEARASPNASSTIRSHAALRAPYVSGVRRRLLPGCELCDGSALHRRHALSA